MYIFTGSPTPLSGKGPSKKMIIITTVCSTTGFVALLICFVVILGSAWTVHRRKKQQQQQQEKDDEEFKLLNNEYFEMWHVDMDWLMCMYNVGMFYSCFNVNQHLIDICSICSVSDTPSLILCHRESRACLCTRSDCMGRQIMWWYKLYH